MASLLSAKLVNLTNAVALRAHLLSPRQSAFWFWWFLWLCCPVGIQATVPLPSSPGSNKDVNLSRWWWGRVVLQALHDVIVHSGVGVEHFPRCTCALKEPSVQLTLHVCVCVLKDLAL